MDVWERLATGVGFLSKTESVCYSCHLHATLVVGWHASLNCWHALVVCMLLLSSASMLFSSKDGSKTVGEVCGKRQREGEGPPSANRKDYGFLVLLVKTKD